MAQVSYWRYVDAFEANLVEKEGCLEPRLGQRYKYLTPDLYDTVTEAQQYLALSYTPEFRIGPFPEDELPDPIAGIIVVAPGNGQPGGGLEIAIDKPLYIQKAIKLTP